MHTPHNIDTILKINKVSFLLPISIATTKKLLTEVSILKSKKV